MGIRQRVKWTIAALLVVGMAIGSTLMISAVPAVLLTNVGQVAEGTLSGIAPVLHLLAIEEVRPIGPTSQFDIPLASIRQITLDFPRIVIETDTHTWIGPYSAFQGIAENLQLSRANEPTVTIPTSSLRAIALHGHALRPVPRVWLGDGHLSMPEISGAAPFAAETCEDCTISAPSTAALRSTAGSETVWNGITTDYVPEEPEELPWWLGLLGMAVAVVVAILLTSSAGSSS